MVFSSSMILGAGMLAVAIIMETIGVVLMMLSYPIGLYLLMFGLTMSTIGIILIVIGLRKISETRFNKD